MEIQPDWRTSGTKEQLEKDIGNGFILKGPGLYLSDIDTILAILPNRSPEMFWKRDTESDESYSVNVYNSTFIDTIFNVVSGYIPIRQDSRKDQQKSKHVRNEF